MTFKGLEELGIADGVVASAALVLAIIAVSYSSSPLEDNKIKSKSCKTCGSMQQAIAAKCPTDGGTVQRTGIQICANANSDTLYIDNGTEVSASNITDVGRLRCIMGWQKTSGAYVNCANTASGTDAGAIHYLCQSGGAYGDNTGLRNPNGDCDGINKTCNVRKRSVTTGGGGVGWFGSSGSS